MDLDDLKQSWQAYDRKLDAALTLNARLLRATLLGRAESAMGRLERLVIVELFVALALLVWLGAFTARHLAEPRFSAPGLMLGLCALGLAVTAGWQLAALGELDYGGPVLQIQARLESIRIRRMRDTQLALVLGPLVWVPVLIVAIKGALGVDAYAVFSHAWIAANVAFGVAVVGVAWWASRRYAGRVDGSPRLRRLMHSLAGHNVNRALGYLGELRSFGQEPAAR